MKGLEKRVLITKDDEAALDAKVDAYIQANGGTNILNAKYVREIGKNVNISDDPSLDRLRSAVELPEVEAWQQAFKLCVAYLRRYKMESTLSSIRDEGAVTPKDTGYTRASDVNGKFRELKHVSENMGVMTFRDRVEALANMK